MKSITTAVDHLLRSPPQNKFYSIIADPPFTKANIVLDAFVKKRTKNGKIAGVVHKTKNNSFQRADEETSTAVNSERQTA